METNSSSNINENSRDTEKYPKAIHYTYLFKWWKAQPNVPLTDSLFCNAVFLTRRKNLGHYLNCTVTKMDKANYFCQHWLSVTYACGSYQQCTELSLPVCIYTHPTPYGISYLKAVSQQEQSYKLIETSLHSNQKQFVHLFLGLTPTAAEEDREQSLLLQNKPSSSCSLRESYLCVYGSQSLG